MIVWLPRILGDRVQLQQVILNLILNAIEATSEIADGPREVLIRSTSEADGVLIDVRDTGAGLPQANPERVFEAFYTTKTSGLGLGLSICRSIVEAHGGRLWATPNEPRGAIFRIMLPIGGRPIGSVEARSV
jgi:signal transduction histidine kinase